MRVFLAFGLVCYCAVVTGADPKQAGLKTECDDDIDKKLCDLLKCVDTNFDAMAKQSVKPAANGAAKPADVDCKIMAINPKKIADVFGNQDLVPLGQAAVTADNWPVIKRAICAALTRE